MNDQPSPECNISSYKKIPKHVAASLHPGSSYSPLMIWVWTVRLLLLPPGFISTELCVGDCSQAICLASFLAQHLFSSLQLEKEEPLLACVAMQAPFPSQQDSYCRPSHSSAIFISPTPVRENPLLSVKLGGSMPSLSH